MRDVGRIADALEALLKLGRWYTSGDRSTLDVLAVKLDETQQWGERVRRLAEHAILRIDAVESDLGKRITTLADRVGP